MLFCSHKYLYHFMQRVIAVLILLVYFSIAAQAQNTPALKDSLINSAFNPILVAAYKKPAGFMTWHINPPRAYTKYAARRGGELMHWPSYPLTTGQIIARQEEWQRRNSQSVGQQIASDVARDIIKNSVNSLIYGRKPAPAVIPKF